MEPAVSIIVPVYNAAEYLGKCIDSILGQSCGDFELLLIDDGSTDGSAAICDAHASDARVRVFHRPNSGVSASRNAGIDAARGTYLQFVDSDDWITPDATKLMTLRAENTRSDLVVADFYRVVGGRAARKGDIDADVPMTVAEYAEEMMENPADYYYGVLWNKLYRRDIVEAHHLRMDPEIKWCEDFLFNLEYLRYCRVITTLKTPIYYYVKRKGSLVAQNAGISKTIHMKTSVFEYYQQFYKHILTDEDYLKSRPQLYRFLIDAAGDSFAAPSILPGSYRLGHERVSISPVLESGSGVLAELYRKKRLFEQSLETAALRHHLTLTEAEVLYCVWKTPGISSHKELQALLGCGRAASFAAMQHLSVLGYVENEEAPARWVLREAAEPILADFARAEEEYFSLMK